jgi:16S rRNA processing protein RimM
VPERRILMGVVGRPHGVRGLVRVHSYTADPAGLATYGPLTDDTGRAWTLRWKGEGIAELRDAEGRPLPDRNAAERLVNARLWLDRDRLPPPEEEEWYLADLIGLQAVDEAGAPVGTVAAVHDYGGGASLEIARDGAPPLLIPFTRAAVPEVDVAGGRLTVCPPAEVDARPPAGDGAEDAA